MILVFILRDNFFKQQVFTVIRFTTCRNVSTEQISDETKTKMFVSFERIRPTDMQACTRVECQFRTMFIANINDY